MTDAAIEAAQLAIECAPTVWGRTNKLRTDGKIYEVGWTEEDKPISDETIHVLGAFADHNEARAFQAKQQRTIAARAAVIAYLEARQRENSTIERAAELDSLRSG